MTKTNRETDLFTCRHEPSCQSFELQPVPVPDGCGEVIALIEKTITTKLQWSYLRIYLELCEKVSARQGF
jgi:hypothetical protein